MKLRDWTDEEREARREQALRLDLGQFIGPGNFAPLWTREELALLGTMPDCEVSKLTDRTENGVRQKRQERGTPNRFDRRNLRRGDG